MVGKGGGGVHYSVPGSVVCAARLSGTNSSLFDSLPLHFLLASFSSLLPTRLPVPSLPQLTPLPRPPTSYRLAALHLSSGSVADFYFSDLE